MSVMLYLCILSVALLMDVCLVCCVFGETIHNMFGCGCYILLLNVMEVFSVDRGALLDRQYMVFRRMCVLCL